MFFTKRKAILLFIICLIFFFLTYQDVKSSEITSVTGYAKVTDGDTIKIDTFKIRLDGIDAPEKKQEWGIGQIQSSINNLITVNFENVGKKTINLSKINLEIININANN